MAWIVQRDHMFEDSLQNPSLAGEKSEDWLDIMADNGKEDLFEWYLYEDTYLVLTGYSTEIDRRPLDELRDFTFEGYRPKLVYSEGGTFTLDDNDTNLG